MNKTKKRQIRKIRVSKKVRSVASAPRLHVYRSSKHIYAQIIDKSGKILASSSDKSIDVSKAKTKSEKAALVGTDIATKAKKAKVKAIAFDRGMYRYHGRVKALAEAARKAGLQF